MHRREVLLLIGAASAASVLSGKGASAQLLQAEKDSPGKPVARWLDLAESLKPALLETVQPPVSLVRPVRDDREFLRYRMETVSPAAVLAERVFHRGDSFIVDFGGHRTGTLSFRLDTRGKAPDAPARLRLVFGEVPSDVAEEFYPYKQEMSPAWLPDEVINIDDLPQAVRLPRRYAFRYVKIEVLSTAPGFGVQFHDLKAHAVTAARTAPAPLNRSPLLNRIDEVSIATLRDCLQTTFEDGPRRDRRLWVGDLRLQALANYATFRANDVVKRCLYLFAGLPREDGLVTACVYEKPQPSYGGIVILDYAALFNVTLADYVSATGDKETGIDLWPVAKRQLEILTKYVSADGLFVDPRDTWIFIDWSDALDRNAAIQGVLIFAYESTLALAKLIGRTDEVPDYPGKIDWMRKAAHRAYFDPARKLFISGAKRQVSWASQAWMTLAKVPRSKAEAAQAIHGAAADRSAVKPGTPYLQHYLVEAMLACGMRREARSLLETYWGGMVKAGADTFWEVYDPTDPLRSPYGDVHINSYCHAWSCTPAYFLRSRGVG